MAVSDAHVSWLFHTSTNTKFFLKPLTNFLTCFCRGENFRLDRVSNLQPPGHESDTLTTEPHGRGFQFGLVYNIVVWGRVNPLTDDKTLALSNMIFRRFHSSSNGIFSLWQNKDVVGKRENTGYVKRFFIYLFFFHLGVKICNCMVKN